MTDLNGKSGEFKPSAYMRQRRPELFPDSVEAPVVPFSREVFEFQLSTLTSRNQEDEFETLCRRLAEKTICPNLKPMTGPTAGGDGKVDSENYPVVEDVALSWFFGYEKEAASDRWAFAFSTQKEWRAKLRNDVRKIAGANRGYKRAYFVSNQYIRSKEQAEVQDKLTSEFGIDVRVLDANWIVGQVMDAGHWQVGAKALGIQVSAATEKKIGPNDARRKNELDEIDELLKESGRYEGREADRADDLLESAILARGLGRPRQEIEGRFSNAYTVAKRVGALNLIAKIVYQRAWTRCFWFDDLVELPAAYDELCDVLPKPNVWECEQRVNLWLLIFPGEKRGVLPTTDASRRREQDLIATLSVLSEETSKPAASLWARTQLATVRSVLRDGLLEPTSWLIQEFKEILEKSRGLPEYPLAAFLNQIDAIGEILAEAPEYDSLIEVVAETSGDLQRNLAVSEFLVKTAERHLNADRPYKAIRLYGRAISKTAYDESRAEFINVNVCIAMAYEDVGLYWSARAHLLIAANNALHRVYQVRESPPRISVTIAAKLVSVEARIGHMPSVLAALRLFFVLSQAIRSSDQRQEELVDFYRQMDNVLAVLAMKTTFEDLSELGTAPSVLDHYDLQMTRLVMLHLLGAEDAIKEYGNESIPPPNDDFFSLLPVQPVNSDLPDACNWRVGDSVWLSSMILGCEVIIQSKLHRESVHFGEALLAAIESFLATSPEDGVFPQVEELRVFIESSEQNEVVLAHTVDEDALGRWEFRVKCSGRIFSAECSERYMSSAIGLLAEIVSRGWKYEDDSVLGVLFEEDEVHDRAFTLFRSPVALQNVHGTETPISWEQCAIEIDAQPIPLSRTEPWKPSACDSIPKEGQANVSSSREYFGHRDLLVSSVVQPHVWDRAKWKGVMYYVDPSYRYPPGFGLIFEGDRQAAEKIFRLWHEMIGDRDGDETIRLSLLTGINKDHPAHYRVSIAPNMDSLRNNASEGQISSIIMRLHEMEPQNSENLDRFQKAFDEVGRFALFPAHFGPGSSQPDPMFDLALPMSRIYILPAWKVTQRDPEIIALREDDNWVLPEGRTDMELREALRKRGSGRMRR